MADRTNSFFFKGKPDPTIFEWCEEAQKAINRLPNIGDDRVYDNSIMAAALVLTAIANKDSKTATGILLAEMQSGKTSAMIILIWVSARVFSRMTDTPLKDVKVGVLLLTNKSLTEIYKQTMERLMRSGIVSSPISDWDPTEILRLENTEFGTTFVESEMLSGGAYNDETEAGRLATAMDHLRRTCCNHVLVLMDEAHFAIQEGQQLDKFIDKVLGIKVMTLPTAHFKPPTLFIGVTGTAHQKMVFPECSYPIALVYAQPGINHVGRKEIGDRIVHVKQLPDYDELVDLLRPHLAQEGKVFIFRVSMSKKRNEAARITDAAMELGYPAQAIQCFNSHEGNLNRASAFISAPRTKSAIVILKMGMGAGVTIKSVRNIGFWWDTGFGDIEAMAQSLGRNMGYTKCRQEATYPIFTDGEKWDEYNRRMDTAADGTLCQPKPKGNRTLRAPKRGWTAHPDANMFTLAPYSEYLAHADMKDYRPEDRTFTHISENKVFNMSAIILGLTGLRTSASRPIVPSRPKNPLHQKDWRALCKKYPQIKGHSNEKYEPGPDDLVFYIKNLSAYVETPKPEHKPTIFTRND
jgi:hypothetical protein